MSSFRNRLLKLLGKANIGNPGISTSDAAVGDVIYYSKLAKRHICVPIGEVNSVDYPMSQYVPIGLVTVPASHDVYGTGEIGVMSLVWMNSSTPSVGSADRTSLGLATSSDAFQSMTQYAKVVYSSSSNGGTSQTALNQYGWMPSDDFTTKQCAHDSSSYYDYTNSGGLGNYYSPSPYLTGGGRNSYYYGYKANGNALADFDGKANSDKLLSSPSVGSAIVAANSFSPDGASAGSWYIPACGELGYALVRMKTLDTSLVKLNSTYGSIAATMYRGRTGMSTRGESGYRRMMDFSNGSVDSIGETVVIYPYRAFIRMNFTPPKTPKMYRYIKLVIDSIHSGTIIQMSELKFLDESGNVFSYPGTLTASSNIATSSGSATNPEDESPIKLFDGDTSTKWCSTEFVAGAYVLADLGEGNGIDINTFTRWCWYTANDTATNSGRNPKSFKLLGSNDGVEFDLLDSVTNLSSVASNQALAYTGTINVSKHEGTLNPSNGVYIQDVDGYFHTEAEYTGAYTANGVAVITSNCRFVMALKDAHSSTCEWGGYGTEVTGIVTTTSESTAKTDYKGDANTTQIINQLSGTPAAKYCRDYKFPNGKVGYMGAAGEWQAAFDNKAAVASALSKCGGTSLSSYYWTSTQYSSNCSWSMAWSYEFLDYVIKNDTIYVRAFAAI